MLMLACKQILPVTNCSQQKNQLESQMTLNGLVKQRKNMFIKEEVLCNDKLPFLLSFHRLKSILLKFLQLCFRFLEF